MKNPPLTQALHAILEAADGQPASMRLICNALADKGYAVLLIVLSFPLCFPITLPGISTPLGLIMACLGVRLALQKPMWWPNWILRKQIPFDLLKTLADKTEAVVKKLRRVMRPRWMFMTQSSIALQCHGILVCILSLLLAAPLPIPFTNTFAAVPLFLLGMALLENDGLVLIAAYILALVCFTAFAMLFWWGSEGIYWLWKEISVNFI